MEIDLLSIAPALSIFKFIIIEFSQVDEGSSLVYSRVTRLVEVFKNAFVANVWRDGLYVFI
jgi:hypothetical protein